jgi:putative lipoic acid-binding regulatory protein
VKQEKIVIPDVSLRISRESTYSACLFTKLTMHEIKPEDSLIEYPCDFPIKVMGVMQESFAQTIVEVVMIHDPTFHAGKLEMRPSSKGNYLALTVTIRAIHREQLDNLYRDLSSHPMVKMVL